MRSVEECYRGPNVRVFRLDGRGVIARLRNCARTLLLAQPRVLEVRLFGSLARGEGRPGSDADLFILLSDSAAPFVERIAPLTKYFCTAGIGCEVIAYTTAEHTAAIARGDAFVRMLETEGIRLARRDDAFTRPA